LIGLVSDSVRWLGYIYPNTFEDWLLSPHADRISEGAAICVAIATVTSAAGAVLFTRKDV
jgi:hypothetical protein